MACMSGNPGDMEVIGFGFKEAWHAEAAETELREILDVGDDDLSIAEVGGDAHSVNGNMVVLAGRIREHRIAEATDVAAGYGGEVLTEVPETWL